MIDHPQYGAVTLSRLLEDMPLGQPTATIRLVCAPELVDDAAPARRARARPLAGNSPTVSRVASR